MMEYTMVVQGIQSLHGDEMEHFTGDISDRVILTVRGNNLSGLSLLDHVSCGSFTAEAAGLGDVCEGARTVLCRMIKKGGIRNGDEVTWRQRVLSFHVITLSDRASAGEYEDRSGPEIRSILKERFTGREPFPEITSSLIPDDPRLLRELITLHASRGTDVVITTGGTGVGERDIVPETLLSMFEKEIPGIMDYVRVTTGASNPNALISRSVAGTIGKTQVYALPGSVKAVREYLKEILRVTDHIRLMLYGIDSHPGHVP